MGIVGIFNLLTVCIFYTSFDPSEVLSDEMCFFGFDCTVHLKGCLHSVLIWRLGLCLSLFHPSTHQAVILCLGNTFQRFSCTCLKMTRLPLNLLKILLGTNTTLLFTTHIVGNVSFFVRGDVDLGLAVHLWSSDKHSRHRHVGPYRWGTVLRRRSFLVLCSVEADWEVPKPSPLHAAPAVVLLLM